MSRWAGKYVIGLTGNIGTGKSVVRRMLEHLGAYGIDADALSHRAIASGAPGYKQVVEQFGKWVLADDGEINRQRLGRIVFSDPEALKTLEGIVHPLVNQALEYIIKRVKHPVVVIEAIKLLESDLKGMCDSIWVTYTPPDIQLKRLVNRRKMSAEDARQRIHSQPPQQEKVRAANVVIRNVGSIEDTWKQVLENWQKLDEKITVQKEPQRILEPAAVLHIVRGTPRNSAEIADFFNRFAPDRKTFSRTDIMEAFGEKAFLLLKQGDRSVGLIGWQVENLVARTVDLIYDTKLEDEKAVTLLVEEMEQASRDLQCEASLIFLRPELARRTAVWQKLGYEHRDPQKLGVNAWQEAARESMPAGTVLFFKKLRTDRILRPI